MKKIAFLSLIIFCVITGACFFFFQFQEPVYTKENCPFCNPIILNRQKFYEDDLTIALCTHKPITPGHCLVIPKRHVERFDLLTDAEADHICKTIKKVNEAAIKVFDISPYLLLQKNGSEVGQSVPHVHFHYIPRKKGDNSMIMLLFEIILAHIKKPISQEKIDKTVKELRQEMQALHYEKNPSNRS